MVSHCIHGKGDGLILWELHSYDYDHTHPLLLVLVLVLWEKTQQ